VAACIAAAAVIPIDKVVTSPGKVVAQAASSVVQPLETAIIHSIEVREGQMVHRGDILARLDPTFAIADSSALEAQFASLTAEVERLLVEASGGQYNPPDAGPATALQRAIFLQHEAERGYKNENYAQKISSLQSLIQRAVIDREAYTERLTVAEEVERKRIELERLQIGSQLNRLSATDSRIEVRRDLSNAISQVVQATRDLRAMEAERDGYNQQWRSQVNQDLLEQSRKLSDTRENLNKAVLRRQLMELRAKQDGIVLNIAKVSPGSVLQSGEQVMALVPTDTPLEVEANISGIDAGFVHPGDTVTVKFDTFPFTQYGAAEGVVRVVSADSFTSNPDEKRRGAQQNQADDGPAFYRARITLDQVKLHNTPPGFRVVPGMPITADIKVGKRTVVGYLLSRALPVAMDGMREP
jgi:hemolysin D